MQSEWLYKGNTRWAVMTRDDEVVVEWGNVNTGKLQTKSYKAKPKNLGRSNFVSAEDQAVKEAVALVKKKEDQGYAPKGVTVQHFLPMLAKDATKIKKWPLEKKYYVQPKLDGIRAIVSKDGVFSRNGKKLNFKVGVEPFLEEGEYLDGELYQHGVDFQTLVSNVRQGKGATSFCVFDGYNSKASSSVFSKRLDVMNKITGHRLLQGVTHNLQVVPTAEFTAKDMDHDQIQAIIEDIHNVYVANGYEGVMIRLDKPYEVGKRSKSLWKYKNFKTEEYKIVDYAECKMVGNDQPYVYVCETKGGQRFNVTPQYTQQDRCNEEVFLVNIGKLLTVKFQELTNDGIPRFPTGVSVRDYE